YTLLDAHEWFDPSCAAVLQLVPARVEPLLHRERNPELPFVSHERTVEALRRHADNGVRHAIEHLGAADPAAIASKALFPHSVTDHHHRMRVAADIFTGLKAATKDRLDSHRIKIIRRHHASGSAFGTVADA